MHKKTITALAISLIATTAQAEWSYFTSADAGRFYIDYSTIKKTRHGVRVWEMIDYRNPGSLGQLSHRILAEYDCNEDRYRDLSITSFTGYGATGDVIIRDDDPNEWHYVAPGTVGEAKLQAVCKHK